MSAGPFPKTDFEGKEIKDPGDTFVKIVVGLLVGLLVAAILGYGLPALAFLALLFTALYFAAPARKFPTAEAVMKGVDLTSKVALITGPTSGIGIDTAKALALAGAHVILVARSVDKLEAVKQQIEAAVKAQPSESPAHACKLTCIPCDLNDLASVKACALKVIAMKTPLHLLVNNAGVMAVPTRVPSKQGLEQQIAVNHFAHFLLTKLLLPVLQQSAPSRIICVSSSAHRFHSGPKWLSHPTLDTEPYNAWVAYGNAKCANILHARALHKRFSSHGVSAFAVMPGGIHTGLQDNVDRYIMFKWILLTPFFFKSTSQGAGTTLTCAVSPDAPASSGEYFENCKPTQIVAKLEAQLGTDAAEKCWAASEKVLKDLQL